ncbi:MAG: hypothetical protein EA001_14375 [Oscillatoriales cyanobacterium]|nr:MAG: hypothetical protein EA001_14375 [Oscillatoriales cyanobacterium]
MNQHGWGSRLFAINGGWADWKPWSAIGLLLAAGGCGFNFKADIEGGNLVVNSDYEISETLLNQHPWNFQGDPASFVSMIDRFEIQEGKIRAFGQFVCPDKRVEAGILDFALRPNRASLLEAKIANIESPCVALSDPRIITVNQLLADTFARLAPKNQSDQMLQVTNVKVGNKKVLMEFRFVAPIESPQPALSPSPALPSNSGTQI